MHKTIKDIRTKHKGVHLTGDAKAAHHAEIMGAMLDVLKSREQEKLARLNRVPNESNKEERRKKRELPHARKGRKPGHSHLEL